jgi:hypothetical protein
MIDAEEIIDLYGTMPVGHGFRELRQVWYDAPRLHMFQLRKILEANPVSRLALMDGNGKGS